MIILRCTNDEGLVADLQVQEDIDLRLDISAIENAEIGTTFGVSSQEFSIPGTNEANQFFGNLYNLGATPAVALVNSINCQVLTDGQQVFNGKLYIKDVTTDQLGYTYYNVVVLNEVIDFKYRIQNLSLTDPKFDFSQYDHLLTAANVTGSWYGNLFSGSIIYPNINYGQPESDLSTPNYAFAGLNVAAGLDNTIDNYDTPLRLFDFKPAIKIRDVIDVIFSGSYTESNVGYNYTSSFFNSAYFNNLYLLTTADDTLGPSSQNPISQNCWVFANPPTTQNVPYNIATEIDFTGTSYDNAGNFNLTTNAYTADVSGSYRFQGQIRFNVNNWADEPETKVNVYVRLNGGGFPILAGTRVNPYASSNTLTYSGNISLNPGDYIEFYVQLRDGDSNQTLTLLPGILNTFVSIQGPTTVVGSTVNIQQQFPDDLKALDLLQGLIEKFNLVVEPVPNERNLLRIEPYSDWTDQGVVVDWTDKVDRDTRFNISHPILEQPRTIIFKDEDDDDYLNLYTRETFDTSYGQYIYTSDSDLAEGERVIGKVFASTPTTNIPNSSEFIIPHLCTKVVGSNNTYQPLAFKPRLLYGVGLKTVESAAAGYSGSAFTTGSYWLLDENGVTTRQSVWYQVSSLSETPISGAALDLHFNNNNVGKGAIPPYWSNVVPNGANFISGSGDAFTTYWAPYINGLYDIDARKLVCNVYLKPTEIQDIALNDKIFIDGAYYRINKINGANLTRRDSVEVELIKTPARKLTFPRRRVTTSLGISVDIIFGGYNPNGGGRYVTYDDGIPFDDYSGLSQAGQQDGLRVYLTGSDSGSVVWNYAEPITPALQQSSLGTNRVNPDSARIMTIGSNNIVESSTNTVYVMGRANNVSQNVTNAFVVGQENSITETLVNNQIVGGSGNAISGSFNVNNAILTSTGSTIFNGDYTTIINGYNATLQDSDVTTLITPHENEVVINGSGHTVIGLNLEGAGLDLLDTRNNSNWLGDTYIGEALFSNNKLLDCGDTVTFDLSDTQYKHDHIFHLNWSGVSPGTTEITLPNAVNNDYKKIIYTFVSDDSFDGSTTVEIVPFGSQTINGNGRFIFSNPNEVVTLYAASGSNWVTLNNDTKHFGSFYDTTDQSASLANTPYSMSLNTVDITGGVTISGTKIYPNRIGTYNIEFSAQYKKNTGGDVKVCTWLAKNGTNVANSNTEVTIAGGSGATTVAAWNFFGITTSTNDYFELRWASDTAGTTIEYNASPFAGPAIPSLIVTVDQIS